jgi:hypothetical protein
MPARKKEKQNAEKEKTDLPVDAAAEPLRELVLPLWSVVSFEKREAKNLTYEEAEAKLAELEKRKVSGLCIITDAAAERMSTEN